MSKVESVVRFTFARKRDLLIIAVLAVSLTSCDRDKVEEASPTPDVTDRAAEEGRGEAEGDGDRVEAPPVKLESPVPLWEGGKSERNIEGLTAAEDGYLLLDLGEHWTPFIFSEQSSPDEKARPNAYRETYLALARGEFPEDRHGWRAKRDKYLELYGILPTLNLLKTRFEKARALECLGDDDYAALRDFEGFLAFKRNRRSARNKARYDELVTELSPVAEASGKPLASLTVQDVRGPQRELVEEFQKLAPSVEAILATQKRLRCEGFYEGRGDVKEGVFDWATHEALAEFERRHRVFGWGFIGKDTLEVLRMTPLETEHEAILRMLTERAMHQAGVIEDGSTATTSDDEPRTYTNAAGETVPIPNLEAELRARIIDAFGLQTPESTYAWLQSLDAAEDTHVVAIRDIKRPDYYSDHMALSAVIDRGDVWYEFPYTAEGKTRRQPVSRRPRITMFVTYNDEKIPLARFGTTIGGWRSEFVEGSTMWKYKGSPAGDRVWTKIVSAPVWVPPTTTIPKSILWGRPGRYRVDRHQTGPSYASAYGLVAAYHRRYYKRGDGYKLGGDQGIRTHGSVDYMSIMRRHSHGCHRMHNHMAVRLMSFVLQHWPHKRLGNYIMDYERIIEHEGEEVLMEFDKGGYVFELAEPLPVRVLRGRVRGAVSSPIEHLLPKFDKEVGAFVMPDGQWVDVDRFGNITPRDQPFDPFELDTLEPPVPGEMPPSGDATPRPSSATRPNPGTTTSGPINAAVAPIGR